MDLKSIKIDILTELSNSKIDLNTVNPEVIKVFAEMYIKAINYTRCCEKLKDKETMTFEEWIDFEGHRDYYNDLQNNGFAYDIGLLYKKYNKFIKHSL